MAKKLIFKCNGKDLEITPVVSGTINDQIHEKSAIYAPGRDSLEISTPVLSAKTVSASTPILCKVAIKGKNIAQITAEVMLQLGKKLIGPICRDFLRSPVDHEIKGGLHPHWSVENDVEFEITPTLRLLYCGEGFTLACMWPEQYGVEAEAQIWSIEGVYQRGGGEPFRAKLEFDNQGQLVRKTGFYPASQGALVSPFELFIEDGDTFEPYITLLAETGEESLATVNPIMLGGGYLLHWVQVKAPAGDYRVGISVEDFDDQLYRNYSLLTIN
jgi:hypothetical protein